MPSYQTMLKNSPNQVLTHAARAAAKQPPLVAARGAREGLWLEQLKNIRSITNKSVKFASTSRHKLYFSLLVMHIESEKKKGLLHEPTSNI